MDDLGSPCDWQLKGEGNANLVFAYTGSDPRLVGRVLRVRKPRAAPAPDQAALEDAVWAPVLGPLAASPLSAASANSSAGLQPQQQDEPNAAEPLVAAAAAAAQREQLYVQRVLAPLLGPHHIPPQQPVRPSPTFLQQLLSSGAVCVSSDAQAVAAAGTAALLPDVTLLPQSTAAALLAPRPQQQAQQQEQQQAQPQQQTPGMPVGPVVCIELKPKCGFVTGCGTVHPANRELKHSRSRYRLHQLLKLSQASRRAGLDAWLVSGCSCWDGLMHQASLLLLQPCDVTLLHCSTSCLFLTIVPLPAVLLLPALQGKISACSAYDPCDLFSGDPARLRSALAALLQQPQNNLLLFVDGRRQELAGQQRRKGRKQQAQQQQQQPQQQQAQGAASLEQLLGGLLPLPPEQRRDALAELLAVVLEREGVLPRLLRAQQQCGYDVEGIYQLYCQLAGLQPEGATADAADNNGRGTSSSSSDTGRGGDSNGVSSSSGSEDADGMAAHAAAVAQLLALHEAEAHAVLRSYVVAATAKDCALMQSFEERQQWWDVVPACIFCPSLGDELLQCGSGGGQEGGASGSGGWSGGWFRYRLCFVDLDLKPLAKIPAHAELDRRIVEAAKRHLCTAGGTAGDP
ncbi:hypothetical protein COHA_004790 [Chlorella ohadii]|uniref:Inositol-pentakisphosphate 2-kinase n=1 Tax=Chlorella ohadii TaxID=2649997 RepID=A0AAD5DT82_9CHLO|nr:hypothetical protein COHA_004790 [Chlorella ohadii]